MNEVIDALAEWKSQTITRGQLLRSLLTYENWMTPMRETAAAFAPFAVTDATLFRDAEGKARICLLSCGETTEIFETAHAAEGGMRLSNPTGWQIFGADLDGVEKVVIDPGAPHELVIGAAEFSEIKEWAEAVRIEEIWKRLRAGNEEEDDMATAARYAGYRIAMVQRDEGVLLVHVPHDAGGMFAPVFTHSDALALAVDEFRESFAPAEIKTLKAGGEKIFPMLAKENADGIVFNFKGPGEPLAFQLGMTELMLAELAKDGDPATETA